MSRLARTLVWLGLLAALLFFRLPERYTAPFFYAEEGPLYFHHAYHHSVVDSLFHVELGYFAAWVNLACTLAAHAVPLEQAPLVTTLMGSLVWVLIGLLVHLDCSPVKGRLPRLVLLAALVLIPVHLGKVHTSFAQHYLCFCTALVLACDATTSLERWVHRGTLLLAGTTGSVSLFLAPLYLWKYLARGRSREFLIQLAILCFCGALQLGVLLYTLRYHPEQVSDKRWAPFELGIWMAAVVDRALMAPFLGLHAMDRAGNWLHQVLTATPRPGAYWPVLLALAIACVGLLAALAGPRSLRTATTRTLFAAWLVITVLGFISAITNQEGTKSDILLKHDRYFVAPNLILATLIATHAFGPGSPGWKRSYRLLLAWILVTGSIVYLWQSPPNLTSGPDWKQEIARWREDPRQPVHTWPVPWRMRLDPEVRARALQ